VSIRLREGFVIGYNNMLGCSRPVPYDCVVTPRSAEVESILAEEYERLGIEK